jgi:hypothetical protein
VPSLLLRPHATTVAAMTATPIVIVMPGNVRSIERE